MTIFFRIYIPAATYWIKPCVEFNVISPIWYNFSQSVVVSQGYRLAMLTPTYIYRLAFYPIFSSCLFGNFPESLIAIFAKIINNNIIGTIHLTYFPVSDVTHPLIHAVHYHGYMFSGWRC